MNSIYFIICKRNNNEWLWPFNSADNLYLNQEMTQTYISNCRNVVKELIVLMSWSFTRVCVSSTLSTCHYVICYMLQPYYAVTILCCHYVMLQPCHTYWHHVLSQSLPPCVVQPCNACRYHAMLHHIILAPCIVTTL